MNLILIIIPKVIIAIGVIPMSTMISIISTIIIITIITIHTVIAKLSRPYNVGLRIVEPRGHFGILRRQADDSIHIIYHVKG